MIVLDIETSGVSAIKNSMLSLGAVKYDTGEEFYAECRITAGRVVEPIALEINGFTLEEIQADGKASDVDIYERFKHWAAGDKLLAGHNVGHFDIIFLEEIHERLYGANVKFPFSYRTVDLHSIAYARFGESLTHEQICLKLGLMPEPKPHNALQGARSERAAFQMLFMHNPAHAIQVTQIR